MTSLSSHSRNRAFTLVELVLAAVVTSAFMVLTIYWVGSMGVLSALSPERSGAEQSSRLFVIQLTDDVDRAVGCDPQRWDFPVGSVSANELVLYLDASGNGLVDRVTWAADPDTGAVTRQVTTGVGGCSFEAEPLEAEVVLTGLDMVSVGAPALFSVVVDGQQQAAECAEGTCDFSALAVNAWVQSGEAVPYVVAAVIPLNLFGSMPPGRPTPPLAPMLSSVVGDWWGLTMDVGVPTSDGGAPLLRYEYTTNGYDWATLVEFSPGEGAPASGEFRVTSTSTAGNLSLTEAVNYPMQVRAVNRVGPGPASVMNPGALLDSMVVTVDTTATHPSFDLSGVNRTVMLGIEDFSEVFVSWGDSSGWTQVISPGTLTHEYSAAGGYQVRIRGDVGRFGVDPGEFADSADYRRAAAKVVGVEQFGDVPLQSLRGAFHNAINFTSVAADLPATLVDLSHVFDNAPSFNDPTVSGWNTAGVTNMAAAFNRATTFNQPLDSWNTANVTDMSGMFSNARVFNHSLSNWNTANVTDMSGMFSDAVVFNQPLDSWNTAQVTDMSGMFSDAVVFNQPLDSWNTAQVTDMSEMFSNARVFNHSLSNWNTANVTDMSRMFFYARAFNGWVHTWNTANVTDMRQMFMEANVYNRAMNTDVGQGRWITSNVTDMTSMFDNARAFNQTIGGWDTSSVTSMSKMFQGAAEFHRSLNGWNTSNVTDMSFMFSGSYVIFDESGSSPAPSMKFNGDITAWDTSNVTNMRQMFGDARLFNRPIGNWDTSNVTDMAFMFRTAEGFNQPIGNWNTANVGTMNSMFLGARSFNQPLNNWNTSAVWSMSSMFHGATEFNQPLNNWNTANVGSMFRMFAGACEVVGFDWKVNCNAYPDNKFLQNISGWDVDNVNNFADFRFKSNLQFINSFVPPKFR